MGRRLHLGGYDGKHYTAKPTEYLCPDPPVQQPRPPVWVVGAHVFGRESQPSLSRAAKWDGLIPQLIEGADRTKVLSPDRLAELVAQVQTLRTDAGLPWDGYDFVFEADSTGEWQQTTPADPAVWADAGATWWIESWWSVERSQAGLAEVRRRVEAGPPG